MSSGLLHSVLAEPKQAVNDDAHLKKRTTVRAAAAG